MKKFYAILLEIYKSVKMIELQHVKMIELQNYIILSNLGSWKISLGPVIRNGPP